MCNRNKEYIRRIEKGLAVHGITPLEYENTRGGHIRAHFQHEASGRKITTILSTSPGDPKAHHNTIRQVKAALFKLEG